MKQEPKPNSASPRNSDPIIGHTTTDNGTAPTNMTAPPCPPRAGYTCWNVDGEITYTKQAPAEPPKPAKSTEDFLWDWAECGATILIFVGAAATVETGFGVALTAAAGVQTVNSCRKAAN